MPLLTSLRTTAHAEPLRAIACGCANRPEIGGDLVGEHLLQPQAEQVWGVAAVGPRRDVAAEARGSARPAVACGAAVGKPGADRAVGIDIAEAVARDRSQALEPRELALKELPSAPDRAERIERDDVRRGIPVGARSAFANLARVGRADQRSGDAFVRDVGRLVLVHQLPGHGARKTGHEDRSARRDRPCAGAFRTMELPMLRRTEMPGETRHAVGSENRRRLRATGYGLRATGYGIRAAGRATPRGFPGAGPGAVASLIAGYVSKCSLPKGDANGTDRFHPQSIHRDHRVDR